MKRSLNKIISAVILASFLTIVLFSFTSMAHGSDGRMSDDCPFSAMGQSLCPQNTVAVALHHIAAYSAFLDAPVSAPRSAFALLLFASLFVTVTVFMWAPRLGPPTRFPVRCHLSRVRSRNEKLLRWLSHFEHSPSYS